MVFQRLARAALRPRFLSHLLPQRQPLKTKSELLLAAKTRFSRAVVHVKWPLTRNNRKLTVDDFSAFALWLVMGNVLWVVLGTTTFGLATLYSLHSFDRFAQAVRGGDKDEDCSYLGYLAGSILSHGLGVRLGFEKGKVLPEFVDGMLRFRNVLVAGDGDVRFSATVKQLSVSLLFRKWCEGKGLIHSAEVLGMHAQVHQPRHVRIATGELLIEPLYDLGAVKVRDSFVEVHGETGTAPLQVTVFNCDLPRLRGDRLLLDFFSANVTGAVNNAMFTIHKHQTRHDRVVRLKIDGIDLASVAAPRSKFNWMVGGRAEIEADIRLPPGQEVQVPIGWLAPSEADRSDGSLLKDAMAALYKTFAPTRIEQENETEYLVVNATVRFHHAKAALPLTLPVAPTAGLPFVLLLDLRLLIAYVNGEHHAPLVVKTMAIEKLGHLHNAASLQHTRMYDAIVADIYEELLRMIKRDERRLVEERTHLWLHAVASQLLLLGLGVLA